MCCCSCCCCFVLSAIVVAAAAVLLLFFVIVVAVVWVGARGWGTGVGERILFVFSPFFIGRTFASRT